jgi:hypothetical protein
MEANPGNIYTMAEIAIAVESSDVMEIRDGGLEASDAGPG